MKNAMTALLLVSVFSFVWSVFAANSLDSRLDTVERVMSKPSDAVAYLYENRSVVNCGSDSMGVLLRCPDMVYGDAVQPDEVLEPGRIYVYKKNSTTNVVHRLVYCIDTNCDEAIFKGDNNFIAEKINRTQIMFRVDMIDYGGKR